jgi:hypothetical protein
MPSFWQMSTLPFLVDIAKHQKGGEKAFHNVGCLIEFIY